MPTENVKIRFANADCIDIIATDSEITCNLSVGPAAGTWDVQLTDSSGLILKETSVEAIDVALNTIDISPSSGLNQLGGDVLTITGSGFD